MSMLRLLLLAAVLGAAAGLADHAFGQQAPQGQQPPQRPDGPPQGAGPRPGQGPDAGPGMGPGQMPRRPPPPEALAACRSLARGAACSFNSPEHGLKKGSCDAPEGRPLACRPSDMPPFPPQQKR